MRNLSARRPIKTDPKFEIKISNFLESEINLNPGQKSIIRNPHKDINEDQMTPAQIIAKHTHGYDTAHKKRVKKTRNTFNKDWNDTARVRQVKAYKIPLGTDCVRKPKDEHILERVLYQNQDHTKMTTKVFLTSPDQHETPVPTTRTSIKRKPLPREERAFERGPPRYYYWGL